MFENILPYLKYGLNISPTSHLCDRISDKQFKGVRTYFGSGSADSVPVTWQHVLGTTARQNIKAVEPRGGRGLSRKTEYIYQSSNRKRPG